MQFGLTSRTGARGFIVIAVLWILAALSALVLIYLTYVTNTAVVVAGSADRVQTEALVSAGVELAVFQLAGRSEEARPTSGTFNARVGAGRVFVTFRSEAARVDLNARAEIAARRPHDRARRQPCQRRRLCRPDHRLARADRTRRQRPREFVLSHIRFILSATPRAVPGDRGIVAGARDSTRHRRADAAAGDGVQQCRADQRAATPRRRCWRRCRTSRRRACSRCCRNAAIPPSTRGCWSGWREARARRSPAPGLTGYPSTPNCRTDGAAPRRSWFCFSKAARSLIVYCRGATAPTAPRHRKRPLRDEPAQRPSVRRSTRGRAAWPAP